MGLWALHTNSFSLCSLTILYCYSPEAHDDPIDLSDDDDDGKHNAATGGYPQPAHPGAEEADPIVLSDGE